MQRILSLALSLSLVFPLTGFAAGDNTYQVLKEHSETSGYATYPGVPVLSQQGVSYWYERIETGGSRLNSSAGVVAEDTRNLAELGDFPVDAPFDVLAGNVLNMGDHYVPGSSGGFSSTPAIFLNGATRLYYYGSNFPGITSSEQVQVSLPNYDDDGTVVFAVRRAANGSDKFSAICRASGSSITVLAKSDTTVIPGSSGTKFTLVERPTVSNGIILFYGEGGGRSGIYQINGTTISEVITSDSAFAIIGFNPSFNSSSDVSYANEGEDIAMAFTSSGGSVHKRVAGVWSTIVGQYAPIPGGTGAFHTFGQVAIQSGRVAFQGARVNQFSPPLQMGIYIESGSSSFEPILNQDDLINGKTMDLIRNIPGGRWWNGPQMSVLASGSNWNAVVSITLAPVELAAEPDTFTVVSKSSTTLDVLANDRCDWGRSLTITSVTQGANGQVAIVGNQVKYTPSKTFSGTDSFSYTITDGIASQTAEVTVVNPHLAMEGSFSQILYLSGQQAVGTVTVKLTNAGSLTGKLLVNGTKFSLKGKVDDQGDFTQSIKRKNLSPLAVNLTFASEDGISHISGNITGDPSPYTLASAAVGLAVLPEEISLKGYNMLLPPDAVSTHPRGHGYAIVKVSKKGLAKVSGRLADGTKFTTSSPLRKDLTLPLFVPLYAAPKGELAGTLTFVTLETSDLSGALTWRKPEPAKPKGIYLDGFSMTTQATGALYIAPVTGTQSLAYSTPADARADVLISDGDIEGLIAECSVSTKDKFTFPAPNAQKLVVKIARASGILTGSFKPEGGKVLKCFGLVHPLLNRAAGHFTGPTSAGIITLDPK